MSVVPLAQRPWLWLVAIFAVVLLSRVPFLDAGYGKHADAWRVARTARLIVEAGDYQPSRPPGFPLHEWLSAGVWKWRVLGLNGLSAAASAAACVLFALYARRIGCRDWALAGLALAGLPAFYVNSVSSKDFPLTLALLLASYLLARSGRGVWTGVLFGCVVGSRPVAIIHGLPVALVLLTSVPAAERARVFLRFLLVSGVIVAGFYAPIFMKFGPDNLKEPYRLASLKASLILHRGTIEVWGVLGLIGLGLMALGAFWKKGARAVIQMVPPPEQCAWLIATAFGLGFYVWLPDQAGYCIPALPFVLLLASQWTSRLAFQIGCVLMMGASFLSQDFHSPGAILVDRQDRQNTLVQVTGFTRFCNQLPKPGVVVCGSWEPIVSVLDLASGGQRYTFLLEPSEVIKLMKERTPIYYTPEMRVFEERVYQIDLAAIGGTDARALYLRGQQQKP